MMIIETESPEETLAFAGKVSELLKSGDVVTLDGDLGAGKTVFSKGIAKGLGIDEPVTSPTFIIMQEYEGGRLPLYHFDVYRIEDPEELYAIGADEYINGSGVCLIEWATQVEEIIPEDAIRVTIVRETEKGDGHRKITVKGLSASDEELLMKKQA